MVKMGSSDDMGSWKIIAMSSPRMRRMARGDNDIEIAGAAVLAGEPDVAPHAGGLLVV